MQDIRARFEFRGTLGAGGMGVVYEAFDRQRGELVAVKTLDNLDPWRVYCLKNEFRTLADVMHPNLAALYELVNDGERWLLVLERVHGRTLQSWVRDVPETQADEQSGVQATTIAHGAVALEKKVVGLGSTTTRAADNSPDFDRIRNAYAAVAHGLAALHAAGIVHRDLKPTNVLVEDSGRVVILDFGLAIDREQSARVDPLRRAGTREYQAPERLRGEPACEASDWYSLGVMLYQSLTGCLPYFSRGQYEAFRTDESGAPHDLDARVPLDLSTLAVQLLHSEPERRPSAREVLSQLGHELREPSTVPAVISDAGLFGRDDELARLQSRLAEATAGQPRCVHVRGESGIGKTALLDAFSSHCSGRRDVVLLRSRCLAAETSPYKGVDGLIDALAVALIAAGELQITNALAADASALLAMFPLLRRVPGLEPADASEPRAESERGRRRRAVSALGLLCRQLASQKTLVLCIEDVQWGDEDGATILLELMAESWLPNTLLIVSSQPAMTTEAVAWNQLHQALQAEVISLLPLSRESCERWVCGMVGEAALGGLVSTIVETSAGHPMFVLQLVQEALEQEPRCARSVDLRTLVDARLAKLSQAQRELVEVLALVARPLRLGSLRSIGVHASETSLRALTAGRWIRSSGPFSRGELEIVHDRLRTLIAETVVGGAATLQHARIAHGLADDETVEPELLCEHFERAGLMNEAAAQAQRAGQQALATMAFARAERMFERALTLRPTVGRERLDVLLGIASAQQGLGRGQRAAEAWTEASRLSTDPAQSRELERRAAEQWLTSGQIEKGLTVLDRVVGTTGIRIPRTRPRAIAELVYFQARLLLAAGRTPAAQGSARERLRADALFAASRAFSMLDVEFALSLQARYHWHALRSGDPERLALALAWSACFRGAFNGPDDPQFQRDSARAEALAADFSDGLAPGFCALARGAANVLSGRYQRGIEALDMAMRLFAGRRGGSAWEQMFTRVLLAGALAWSGRLGQLSRELEVWLRDADDRSDSYTATMLRIRASNGLRYLAQNDPRALLNEVDTQLSCWPKHHMAEDLSQRYAGWLKAFAWLASGNSEEAQRHFVTVERGELTGRVLTPHALRAEVELLRGLIAVSRSRVDSRRLHRAIVRMDADPRPYGTPFAWTLRAALALRRGQPAEDALQRAQSTAQQAGLLALAASADVVRRSLRSSQPIGEPRGEHFLRAEGVVDPERFARFWFVPWTLAQR